MSKLFIADKFGQVPNSLLNNPHISLKAKGLYGYMQSKPDGWTFGVKLIASQCAEGHKAITSALKELEQHHYLYRRNFQGEGGFWKTEYYLYSRPTPPYGVSDDGVSRNGTSLVIKKSKKEKNLSANAENNKNMYNDDFESVVDLDSGEVIENNPKKKRGEVTEAKREVLRDFYRVRLGLSTDARIPIDAQFKHEYMVFSDQLTTLSHLKRDRYLDVMRYCKNTFESWSLAAVVRNIYNDKI